MPLFFSSVKHFFSLIKKLLVSATLEKILLAQDSALCTFTAKELMANFGQNLYFKNSNQPQSSLRVSSKVTWLGLLPLLESSALATRRVLMCSFLSPSSSSLLQLEEWGLSSKPRLGRHATWQARPC